MNNIRRFVLADPVNSVKHDKLLSAGARFTRFCYFIIPIFLLTANTPYVSDHLYPCFRVLQIWFWRMTISLPLLRYRSPLPLLSAVLLLIDISVLAAGSYCFVIVFVI
jgi:hypothetical protein